MKPMRISVPPNQNPVLHAGDNSSEFIVDRSEDLSAFRSTKTYDFEAVFKRISRQQIESSTNLPVLKKLTQPKRSSMKIIGSVQQHSARGSGIADSTGITSRTRTECSSCSCSSSSSCSSIKGNHLRDKSAFTQQKGHQKMKTPTKKGFQRALIRSASQRRTASYSAGGSDAAGESLTSRMMFLDVSQIKRKVSNSKILNSDYFVLGNQVSKNQNSFFNSRNPSIQSSPMPSPREDILSQPKEVESIRELEITYKRTKQKLIKDRKQLNREKEMLSRHEGGFLSARESISQGSATTNSAVTASMMTRRREQFQWLNRGVVEKIIETANSVINPIYGSQNQQSTHRQSTQQQQQSQEKLFAKSQSDSRFSSKPNGMQSSTGEKASQFFSMNASEKKQKVRDRKSIEQFSNTLMEKGLVRNDEKQLLNPKLQIQQYFLRRDISEQKKSLSFSKLVKKFERQQGKESQEIVSMLQTMQPFFLPNHKSRSGQSMQMSQQSGYLQMGKTPLPSQEFLRKRCKVNHHRAGEKGQDLSELSGIPITSSTSTFDGLPAGQKNSQQLLNSGKTQNSNLSTAGVTALPKSQFHSSINGQLPISGEGITPFQVEVEEEQYDDNDQ